MTAFNGNGDYPTKKILELMAKHAGIKLSAVNLMIEEIHDALASAKNIFSDAEISKSTTAEILNVFVKMRGSL